MALLTDRKFIHFNRKSDFEALLNANTISDKLIVFLKDAQEIWTHGTYYNSVEQFLDETNKDSTNAISAAAVYKALTDDEKTIAAALNDLNDRIENLDIPSKVSDLTDDLSLATLEYVDDKLDDVLGVSAAGVEAFVNMTRDEDTATGILTEIANKAPKTNAVNGAPLSNTESYFYGTSTTAAATALKEVSIPSITSLKTGQIIVVKPTITSTVANSTIKLNNFTAYPMRYNNAAITTSTDSIVWAANIPSIWVFDGTYWVFLGHGLDSNTTYSAMTQAEATTGIATTARTISAKVLHDTIEESVPIKSIALNGTALTPDANKAVNISITNEGLGNGYAIQTDNGQTQNITASLTGYVLTINGRVSVKFNHDATYTPTLNINGTGAKTIKLADGSSLYQDYDYIKGGDIATFVYDGTYYRLVNVQRPKEFDSFLVPDPIELTLTDDSSSGIKVCSFSRNGATVHLPFWSTDTVLYNGVVYSDPQWSDAGPNLETYVFSNTSTEGIIQYLTIYHQFDPTYMGMVDEKWFVVTDEIVKTISIGASVLSEFYEPSSLDNEDLELAAGDTYEEAFGKLEKSINDNEQITAAALTDLDSRINTLHLPQSLDDIPDGSTRKLSDYATTTLLATKQDTLVSGTNIKTINNESILGSGNITIQGGGGDTNIIETVKVNNSALTPDANKAVNITIKSLNTTNTTSQATNANEAINGTGSINLHKIAKTGRDSDLIPNVITLTLTDDSTEENIKHCTFTRDDGSSAYFAFNYLDTIEYEGLTFKNPVYKEIYQGLECLTFTCITPLDEPSASELAILRIFHEYDPTYQGGTERTYIDTSISFNSYYPESYYEIININGAIKDITLLLQATSLREENVHLFVNLLSNGYYINNDGSIFPLGMFYKDSGLLTFIPGGQVVSYNYQDDEYDLENYTSIYTHPIYLGIKSYENYDPEDLGLSNPNYELPKDMLNLDFVLYPDIFDFGVPSWISTTIGETSIAPAIGVVLDGLFGTIDEQSKITDICLIKVKTLARRNNFMAQYDYLLQVTEILLGVNKERTITTWWRTTGEANAFDFRNVAWTDRSSGGDVNVIESIKVNGTALIPDSNKAVNITSIPSSIVTQDATHRFVSDTEKTTWNGKQNALQHYTENNGVDISTLISEGDIDIASYDDNGGYPVAEAIFGSNGIELNAKQTSTGSGDEVGHTVTLSFEGFKYDNKLVATVDQIPSAVTESTVSGWGFTKNAGTITGITMNGASKGTSGVVNLGTVLTEHQTLKTINNESIVGTGNLTVSGLPTVTASDNGKILQVVNGAWALVTPTAIYSGTSTPDNTQGNNGDLYLQTS